jgi:membrane associated rhomboid family serine protease
MYGNGYMMRRPLGPAVKLLLIINVAVFLVQFLLTPTSFGQFLPAYFGLHRIGVLHGMLWQPVTYMFLHGGFMHLLVNMLGLYFLGPEVESILGKRRFMQLYLFCGVLGGLGWMVLSGLNAVCVGASGAVLGIAGTFAGMFPQRRITMLIYFVIPVTMTAITMAMVYAGITLFMLVFGRGGDVAHAAHLFGGLAGFLYGKNLRIGVVRRGSGRGKGLAALFYDLRARYRRGKYRVMTMDPEPVDQRRVNAVLDKISRQGLGSLTRAEKDVLDRASRKK